MEPLEKQRARYFSETEATMKLGVCVRISWKIRGRTVKSKGMATRMFRVADIGYSLLLECVTTEGELISKLFDKTSYETWVVELPSSVDDHYSRRDTPLGKLLSQWPFIREGL